jgi:hypothetical protein
MGRKSLQLLRVRHPTHYRRRGKGAYRSRNPRKNLKCRDPSITIERISTIKELKSSKGKICSLQD